MDNIMGMDTPHPLLTLSLANQQPNKQTTIASSQYADQREPRNHASSTTTNKPKQGKGNTSI
jgi:hypothetical protein